MDYYAKGHATYYLHRRRDRQPVEGTNLTNPHIIDNVESITDIAGRKVTFDYTEQGWMGRLPLHVANTRPRRSVAGTTHP